METIKRSTERQLQSEGLKILEHHLEQLKWQHKQGELLPLQRAIATIMGGVHHSVQTPVAAELLKEIGHDYKTAVDWFCQYNRFQKPFFIRWGSTLLAWDEESALYPIVAEVVRLFYTGKVRPMHPEVKEWMKANPLDIEQAFIWVCNIVAFPVWINDEVFVLDLEQMVGRRLSEDYMRYWKLFNTYSAWQ